MLTEIYKSNKAFLIPYLIFLLIGLPIIIAFPKSDTHLFITSYFCKIGDFCFKYITHLGSGLSPVLVGFVFLFISVRKAFFVAAAPSFAGLLAQLLKLFVFSNVSRPLAYFKDIAQLHIVEGVDMHYSYSFPSGHSATIFALCFSVSLLIKNKLTKTALFFIAIIVAYSRVYLSQHFLNDIYAGSIIGIISVPIMKNAFYGIKRNWADNSLARIIKSSREKV